ncbi:hypothetical protein [Paenibacillus sp. FSL R5-0908]|uniref:hypothetical protein n=1 Tax=Paenibacillus sp. FSL R5-0908 TaxID=2921664 RepID=UPI0030F6598A
MISSKEVLLTQEQAEERLRYWQHKLNLQDWDIVVEVCRMKDIDGDAKVFYQETMKNAKIWLGNTIDYSPTIPQPLDMEQGLVHELGHILLAGITRETGKNDGNYDQYVKMENAVEAFAWALISLDRRAEETENYYMNLLYPKQPLSLMAGDMAVHIRTADQQDGGPGL